MYSLRSLCAGGTDDFAEQALLSEKTCSQNRRCCAATRGLRWSFQIGIIAPMTKRQIHDDELHVQFGTFSCYRRRRLLDHPRARQVVMGVLTGELHKHNGTCCGFVVMPDHVHAILRFPEVGRFRPAGRHCRGVPLALPAISLQYLRSRARRESPGLIGFLWMYRRDSAIAENPVWPKCLWSGSRTVARFGPDND